MANLASIQALLPQMAAAEVSVAVFPELSLSGYSAEDLFFSESLIQASRQALIELCRHNVLPLIAVGLPWRLRDGRLLNCAALISGQRLLGMVPKSTQPNYGEFYDLRWFYQADHVNERVVDSALGSFDIRTDQLFAMGETLIGVEICEDLWAPNTPGTQACLAGASIMLNLSASNELIAKTDYRRDLVRMTSAKTLCAYLYAAASTSESTKDVVHGGHCLIAENGHLLAESERFLLHSHSITCDIDLQWLQHDRAQNTTFRQARRPRAYRVVGAQDAQTLTQLQRPLNPSPFVPSDEAEFDARANDILSIQSSGLARRLQAANTERLVIGLSGGLDSTLAYLVCLDTLQKLDLPTSHLHALTLPGPGTTPNTLNNAKQLCSAAGSPIEEIPIGPAVEQHLADLKHDGEHDVVYENAQARERTQILFNYANQVNGIVVGTGDLSELALGWCTYNADHMAGYNVNASIPKTMMAYLVRWYAAHRADQTLAKVLEAVLATPISPELLPPKDGEISQQTEDIVGPYELHDFFMFHYLRYGASPTKIYHLALLSFADGYAPQEIQRWLGIFFRRFMQAQFKRTTLPPGPKVGSISLSPRGDWRMPDEAEFEQMMIEIDQL